MAKKAQAIRVIFDLQITGLYETLERLDRDSSEMCGFRLRDKITITHAVNFTREVRSAPVAKDLDPKIQCANLHYAGRARFADG